MKKKLTERLLFSYNLFLSSSEVALSWIAKEYFAMKKALEVKTSKPSVVNKNKILSKKNKENLKDLADNFYFHIKLLCTFLPFYVEKFIDNLVQLHDILNVRERKCSKISV